VFFSYFRGNFFVVLFLCEKPNSVYPFYLYVSMFFNLVVICVQKLFLFSVFPSVVGVYPAGVEDPDVAVGGVAKILFCGLSFR